MYIGFRVKYPLFLSDIKETLNFSTDFCKNAYIKFHENPSSEIRVVLCERTDGRIDKRT